MRVHILDDYQNSIPTLDVFKRLSGHDVTVHTDTLTDIDALAERLQTAEAVVLIRERTTISDALLSKLPNLKLVAQTGRVGKHVDVEACTRHGVAVVDAAGSPVAAAELTWALIMAGSRRLPQYLAQLKQGVWQRNGLEDDPGTAALALGTVLRGRTLGVYGYGKIGALLAGYGRAFGMNVHIWARPQTQEKARQDGYETPSSKEAFFADSDVITLNLRLVDDTRGIVTAQDLARMKPTALLVNTARAELIAPGALVAALQAGRPGLAAVDVYDQEPLPATDALLALPNAICSPHIGFVERASYEQYLGDAFTSIVAWAAGKPASLVNPEVLDNARP